MAYVDGFVIPVSADKKQAFIDHAQEMDRLFIEHGAVRVVECWSDDVPDGKVTDFRRSVQAGEGEHVVFSWVEWPSKEVRDAGMKKMMDDERMNVPMPFDGKRMIFGGFVPVVEL